MFSVTKHGQRSLSMKSMQINVTNPLEFDICGNQFIGMVEPCSCTLSINLMLYDMI